MRPIDDPYHPPKALRPPLVMGELAGDVYHFAGTLFDPATKRADTEKFESVAMRMRDIPGVTGLYLGRDFPLPALSTASIDSAMVETFSSMDAVRRYLPHPLHRATIDVSRALAKGGMAIYCMPLAAFASAPISMTPACMQIVLIWLSAEENRWDINSLIAAAQGLRTIPGVTDVKFGPRAPTTWVGPDDTFDCAVLISFDSCENALAAVEHEAHKTMRQQMEAMSNRNQWYSFTCKN